MAKAMVSREPQAWLNGSERARLHALEGTIERGVRMFVEVGKALVEIRDQRFYRDSHSSFEVYCRDRWGFSKVRATQYIGAAEVVTTVTTQGGSEPPNEAVARELGKQKDDPEAMLETWDATIAEHGSKPTAAQVEATRKANTPSLRSVPSTDTRFTKVEEAVAVLQTLPDPDSLVFPEEPGDIEAFDEAIEWLASWTPKMRSAWKAHAKRVKAA